MQNTKSGFQRAKRIIERHPDLSETSSGHKYLFGRKVKFLTIFQDNLIKKLPWTRPEKGIVCDKPWGKKCKE